MFYLSRETFCNLSWWKKFPRGNVVKHLYSQVPSPGVMWTWVSRVLCECCWSVCLSACSVWLSCAHICCWQGLASGADEPLCGAHFPGDRAVCASCPLPMARARSRDGCWSHASVTRLAGVALLLDHLWHSWAQLEAAALFIMLF